MLRIKCNWIGCHCFVFAFCFSHVLDDKKTHKPTDNSGAGALRLAMLRVFAQKQQDKDATDAIVLYKPAASSTWFSLVGVPVLRFLFNMVKRADVQHQQLDENSEEIQQQPLMPAKIAIATLSIYYSLLFSFFTHVSNK